MAEKKAPTKKQLSNTVKDVSTRLEELEAQIVELTQQNKSLATRQDTATECFDQRTRQLLAWASEISKAAEEEVSGMAEAAEKEDSGEDATLLISQAKEGAAAVAEASEQLKDKDNAPALGRSVSAQVK